MLQGGTDFRSMRFDRWRPTAKSKRMRFFTILSNAANFPGPREVAGNLCTSPRCAGAHHSPARPATWRPPANAVTPPPALSPAPWRLWWYQLGMLVPFFRGSSFFSGEPAVILRQQLRSYRFLLRKSGLLCPRWWNWWVMGHLVKKHRCDRCPGKVGEMLGTGYD